MSLSDRIAAKTAGKTVRVRPVPTRIAASFPKRRYGRIAYELWQIGLPLTDAAFGILRGPEDLATLINLRGVGEPTKEASQKVNDFLRRHANTAVTDLKRWLDLGRRPGRPLDRSKQRVWAVGAALRQEDPRKWSWAKITLKLDPSGYAEDRLRATDRMRMGIEALQKRQARENKSRP